MKLNHKFALLLAGAVLAGSLTGCGASGTPASSAASSEAAASSAVSEAASEPAAEAALPDGVYTADFDTDSSMFHAVNALMLCSMIHKCSLNILHSGNQKHISHKQCKLYKCLNYCNCKFRSANPSAKTCKGVWQQHKGGN